MSSPTDTKSLTDTSNLKIGGGMAYTLLVIGLYTISFIYTNYVIVAIVASFLLFLGVGVYIRYSEGASIIYGLLFLSVFSFTMSYIAIAVTAIQL
jgi:hypothetical protein